MSRCKNLFTTTAPSTFRWLCSWSASRCLSRSVVAGAANETTQFAQ